MTDSACCLLIVVMSPLSMSRFCSRILQIHPDPSRLVEVTSNEVRLMRLDERVDGRAERVGGDEQGGSKERFSLRAF